MIWNTDDLWNKAHLYAQKANEFGKEDWEFPFWSSLSLELLARASLVNIHPTLNADPQNEGLNIMYALGYPIKGEPRSIPIHAVLARLERLIDGFDAKQQKFCGYFVLLRNQELHTGAMPFVDLTRAEWLARFYEVAKTLCESLGKTLADLLGDEVAKTADELIDVLHLEKLADVKKRLADRKKLIEGKSEEEMKKLRELAAQPSNFMRGNAAKTTCPACGSVARIDGRLGRFSEPYYRDGEFLEDHEYVANSMLCFVCDLKLSGLDELHIAEVEPKFTVTYQADLHEYFQQEYEEDYNNM